MIRNITTALLALCLFTAPLQAEQLPPQAQAFFDKLMKETGLGLDCSMNLIAAQREFSELQIEVKRLKDKYEPVATAKPTE